MAATLPLNVGAAIMKLKTYLNQAVPHNLCISNCEHFANWCRYGRRKGDQARQYRSLAHKCCCLFFLGTVIFCVVAIALTANFEKIQLVQPAYLLVNLPALTAHDSFLGVRGVSSFKSIVHASQLPTFPSAPKHRHGLFSYELSQRDIESLSEMLQVLHRIMVNASIGYFLYKILLLIILKTTLSSLPVFTLSQPGALLGSYRHHSIIPWDDDIDLIVHEKDKKEIQSVFHVEQYTLDVSSNRYKVFQNSSGHAIRSKRWKSPFLDISFYKENATHLWDITLPRQKPYNKSDIFPLADRPFLGHLYPAPRDPLRVLQMNYDLDQCSTGTYNHTSERKKTADKVKTVPCSSLLDAIPFVQHVRGPGGAWCEEVLTYRGQVVGSFARVSTNISVC